MSEQITGNRPSFFCWLLGFVAQTAGIHKNALFIGTNLKGLVAVHLIIDASDDQFITAKLNGALKICT